ncbi:MAG: phosphotriesterase-related protein [Syntrophorhabdales bacterium]|jgi:phosphotriesterase-related protein
MEKTVMTVTGPISSNKLGVTLMHEHFAFAFPGWYADDSLAPYDREATEATCLKVLKDVSAVGVTTVVDATPADVGGRDPVLLKSLSEKSGVNIIAVTGIYTETGGASGYYKWQSTMGGRNLEEDFYELFLKEIAVGIGTSGVKAGLIKVATSDPVITDYEEKVIRAALRVSKERGVPIITHTDGATVGPAQQDLFLRLGANPRGIMIGHQNNGGDIAYCLSELQKAGFFIAFDRNSIPMMPLAAEDNMISLVKQGYADRIMLSHDSILVWLGRPMNPPAEWAVWYPTYIHKKLIPKMKAAGVTDEQVNTILVDNPRRLFEEA